MQITDKWRKSTKCGSAPDCAEVRRNPENGRIEIRNSKTPLAGTASFTDSEWIAFTNGVEAGEFEIE